MEVCKPFWQKPLKELTNEEWEALCDGCGLCCINKLEDEDGNLYLTNVACSLLDLENNQCSHYAERKRHVPECIQLNYSKLKKINWLPDSCAYLRRYQNRPLPDWHYLISGDRELLHRKGISLRGRLIGEKEVRGPLHHYIIRDL